jgi:hypothetical protein
MYKCSNGIMRLMYITVAWNVVEAYRVYRVRHLLPDLGLSQLIWSKQEN